MSTSLTGDTVTTNTSNLRSWIIKAGLFAASFAACCVIFDVEIALILTYGVFVHEAGHVKASTWLGLATKGVYFLPFVGAVAVSETPRTRGQEVLIQLMGPGFGLLSVIPLASSAVLTGDARWWHYTFLVAGLNLFNMLPIGALDGGQIVLAIAQSIGRRTTLALFSIGAALGLGLAIWTQSWIVAAIFALAVGAWAWSLRKASAVTPAPLSKTGIMLCAIAYLALFLLLTGAVALSLAKPPF